MIPRLAFVTIAAFWAVMNLLLWREEYGSRGNGLSLPTELVWRKILTAPDSSSLTLYQEGKRIGFCQLATGVEQAMAALEEGKPLPEGIVREAGYRIQFDGNVSVGEFTNRFAFNGRIQFSASRAWRELYLRLSARGYTMEIHSLATHPTIHLKITGTGLTMDSDFSIADAQNPGTLLQRITGAAAGELPGVPELTSPLPIPGAPAGHLHWEAHLERLMMGHEPVSAYRLETRVFDQPLVIFVSTLGEILRVELPGGVIAVLDQPGGA